jgi:hypothetical protein
MTASQLVIAKTVICRDYAGDVDISVFAVKALASHTLNCHAIDVSEAVSVTSQGGRDEEDNPARPKSQDYQLLTTTQFTIFSKE